MGIPKLLRKVFLLDLLQGLKVTFRYQDPREIYTEQYPLQRPQVAERYRGAPRLNVNPDTNETMCIACDLCALACPENLIVVTSARNEQTRRKELTNFTYDLSRCMFCGLCEDACPVDALELTQDFELASYTREGAIWNREMLEKGPQPTQYRKWSSVVGRPKPNRPSERPTTIDRRLVAAASCNAWLQSPRSDLPSRCRRPRGRGRRRPEYPEQRGRSDR